MRFRAVIAIAAALVTVNLLADDFSTSEPGNRVPPVKRVVSLAPHITELFFAAGAGDLLVGVVEYSDFPEQAREVPRVGDAFRADLEKIALLEPDLVAVWGSGTPRALQEKLAALKLRTVTFEASELEHIAASLEQIGKLTGRVETANHAARTFRLEIEALQRANDGKAELEYFYQISERPLYTVSGMHFISKAIEICGGKNVFGDLDTLAPTVTVESVIARNPEVIIAGKFPGMEADPLNLWRGFPGMQATASENLYLVDAELIARSTPRIVTGISQACESLEAARKKRTD